MSMTGAKVSHNRFGGGVIEKMENGYISVRFDGMEEEKEFVYPDAFQVFLHLEDEQFQEELGTALAQKRLQEANARAARNDRLIKLQEKISAEKAASRVKPQTKTAKKA